MTQEAAKVRPAPVSSGGTALLAWCDIPAVDEPAFAEWYNREHMRDRVLGLPGFKRGRRFVAVDAAPKYLALYETKDASVLQSEEYLALINTPDPASHYFITRFQNAIRTIAHVRASVGEGEGAAMLVLPFSALAGAEASLRTMLLNELMPEIHAQRGIIAARLIERDESALATSRKRHVRQGDRTLDWALLVEADTEGHLAKLAASHLNADRLAGATANPAIPMKSAIFRLLYRVSP
jgi:hypothetical protein